MGFLNEIKKTLLQEAIKKAAPIVVDKSIDVIDGVINSVAKEVKKNKIVETSKAVKLDRLLYNKYEIVLYSHGIEINGGKIYYLKDIIDIRIDLTLNTANGKKTIDISDSEKYANTILVNYTFRIITKRDTWNVSTDILNRPIEHDTVESYIRKLKKFRNTFYELKY